LKEILILMKLLLLLTKKTLILMKKHLMNTNDGLEGTGIRAVSRPPV
jgi:hypothetical protein